jgi:hypothetical protein
MELERGAVTTAVALGDVLLAQRQLTSPDDAELGEERVILGVRFRCVADHGFYLQHMWMVVGVVVVADGMSPGALR